MNEPISTDEPAIAQVVLKLYSDNNRLIELDGDEGHLVELLSYAFFTQPDLQKIFYKAYRFWRFYYQRKNN